MKKTLLVLTAIITISCSTDEVSNADNCNCTKENYEVQITVYNGKTFVDHVLTHSETVICQEETKTNVFTGDDTYYKIVCD